MTYIAVNVDNGDAQIVYDNTYITSNFLFSEYACKDGSDVILYSQRLADIVQAIRDITGPLSINSAFRNPSHNKAVGGVQPSFTAKGSKHLYGIAVDLKLPSGYDTYDFAQVVEEVAGKLCGIGKYETFVHLDIRGTEARWTG